MTSLPENHQANIFFDPDGTPKRQPSFCVYVDILGFKDILKSADSAFHHFMENIRPAFRSFAIPSKSDSFYHPERWQAKVFSDNVFLVYPFERCIMGSGDGESEFGSVVDKIAWFQLECFVNDYFLRGGFSFGEMFIDEETIFGETLAELVEIEKTTMFPRIALSPRLFPFLNTYSSFYANSRPSVFDNFLIDSGGAIFIDYLYHVIKITEYDFEYQGERRERGSSYNLEALERHKEVVQNNLKKHVSKPNVFLKYLWLASYHNYCCERYESCPDFSNSLFICGSFPDYGLRPLGLEDIKEYGSTRDEVPTTSEIL